MKLIATDLDRTLMPNGKEKSSKNSLSLLKKLLKKNNTKLAYITGRNKNQILWAMKRYNLPLPNYVAANVGSTIYSFDKKFKKEENWTNFLKKSCPDCSNKKIKIILKDIKEIKLQEKSRQRIFKTSYYIKLNSNTKKILKKIKRTLSSHKINAEIIYSIDSQKNTGLVDILPKKGTKIGALKFIIKKLNVKKENVMFAGDSGNDLLALASGYKAVLVKNSSDEVKKEFKKIAKQKKITKNIYIAKGNFKGLNGNYSSGIIEGAFHHKIFL